MGVLLVIVLFSVGEWGVEDLVLRIGVRGRINIGGGVGVGWLPGLSSMASAGICFRG